MSNDPSGLDRRLWRPASELSDAGPARWDGAAVGDDVTLEVWVGPKNGVGARYFRCYLRSDLGRTREPVVFGMQNAGPYPGYNWVEVIDYHAVVALESGQEVEVPGGIERLIFEQFAKLVPPGGHLMAPKKGWKIRLMSSPWHFPREAVRPLISEPEVSVCASSASCS